MTRARTSWAGRQSAHASLLLNICRRAGRLPQSRWWAKLKPCQAPATPKPANTCAITGGRQQHPHHHRMPRSPASPLACPSPHHQAPPAPHQRPSTHLPADDAKGVDVCGARVVALAQHLGRRVGEHVGAQRLPGLGVLAVQRQAASGADLEVQRWGGGSGGAPGDTGGSGEEPGAGQTAAWMGSWLQGGPACAASQAAGSRRASSSARACLHRLPFSA